MDAMMPRGERWTDESKRVVRDYWMQGYSALWIGNKLGKTRRSIMGLVWRMGLMRADRPANPAPHRQLKRNQYSGRLPVRAILGKKRSDGTPVSLASIPMPEPSVAAKNSYRQGGKIKLADLTSTTCRWPLGDPQHKDFGYCGAPTDGVCPYCLIHNKVAFHALQRRA